MAALLLAAAEPDTFTREELNALETEKLAAERKLAVLESTGTEAMKDIGNIDAELIAAAMESQRREEQASDAEKSLIDLGTRRVAAQMRLLENQQALEDLLAALAASNRRKPPALVVSPGKANDAVRRAILMSETTPRLAEQTSAVRTEIDELNTLERRIRGEKARLDAAEATLALKQLEIEQLAAAKRAQFQDLSGDIAVLKSQTADLAAQADTLRGLLGALESAAPTAPGVKPVRVAVTRPAPKPKPMTPTPRPSAPLGKAALGALKQPVSGNVLYRFGDKMPSGGKAEWITFQTRSEAQVAAPAAGTVEYARPFRSYGSMLILRTSDGYHVILSGMSRIYVAEGQSVSAGEPVGRMPDRASPPPELNMELRLGDAVMNPADWMPRGG
ncbi:MAG: peptidoglycan DD-metalloendopeptidase family protein [Hyphomonas sp.]|nr:peptidoglycan DD-metalloendopeptidase family protein [Hyphomonas sp.]